MKIMLFYRFVQLKCKIIRKNSLKRLQKSIKYGII